METQDYHSKWQWSLTSDSTFQWGLPVCSRFDFKTMKINCCMIELVHGTALKKYCQICTFNLHLSLLRGYFRRSQTIFIMQATDMALTYINVGKTKQFGKLSFLLRKVVPRRARMVNMIARARYAFMHVQNLYANPHIDKERSVGNVALYLSWMDAFRICRYGYRTMIKIQDYLKYAYLFNRTRFIMLNPAFVYIGILLNVVSIICTIQF